MIRSKLGAAALIVLMMGIFALVACGEDTVPTEASGVTSTPGTLDLPSAPVPSALSTPLAAPPEVPEELIQGEMPEDLEASLASARKVVEKIARQLEERVSSERVPVGAPVRRGPDISALSPKEKILYALQRR